MLRLYENNVQFYIRDLSICGFLFRSVGCHGSKPVWILVAGVVGLYSLCPPPTSCSLNGAKLSSLFSLNHCKERMFKLLPEIAFLP